MTILTRYLKLRIEATATSNAKYNLDRIDDAFSFKQVTEDGLQIFTSANGFLFRPYGGTAGGTINWGEHGADVTAFNIYGTLFAKSLAIGNTPTGTTCTFLPNPSTTSSYNIMLPDRQGLAGEYLGFSMDGVLSPMAIPGFTMPVLPLSSVWVGNSSSVADATDTTSQGDIEASTSSGLTIKDGKVLNKHLGELIPFASMEVLAANKVIATDSLGVAQATSISVADLEAMTVVAGFSQGFVTADWSGPTSSLYYQTFLTSNHGQGSNFLVQTFDTSGLVQCDTVLISTAGVTIKVPSDPDCRFDGKIVIKKV